MINSLTTSTQAYSLRDLMNACLKEMAENDCSFDGPLLTNEGLQRYSRNHKKNPDEWYVCYEGISSRDFPYLICIYGSWSDSATYRFKSYEKNASLNEIERRELQELYRKKQEEALRLLEEEAKERIRCAQRWWNRASNNPSTKEHMNYLTAKKVGVHGVRFGQNKDRESVVVIPLTNIAGEVQAVQYIKSDGEKRIYGVKKGHFHVIGEITATSHIQIVEGYATGATIYQATGNPVVIAISCDNLDAVLSNIRTKYPTHMITIAADDDIETKKNPGKTKAEAAANKYNCNVILPKFQEEFRIPGSTSEEKPHGIRPTDFNDLHVHFGIEKVTTQLQLALEIGNQVKKNNCHSTSFQFRSAYSLAKHPTKSNWLIKQYIDAGSLMEIFGDPGCMKTFLALGLGLSIATGFPCYGLAIIKTGTVFYIAGEGFHGIPKRLQAWSLGNGVDLKDIPFFISNQPAQFLNDASAKEVILAIEELKEKHGQPTFVVIDTLNRNFGPGDESDNADMTKFIMAIDTSIRLRYECTVLILHHPPLNDPKRGRGASSLYGALDWAYSLKKDGKVITLSNTKVKDHEPPPNISFKPETIPLPGWVDEEDGTTMTSCVLKKIDDNAIQKNDSKSKLTPSQKVVFDCLVKLCVTDDSDDFDGVFIDDWRSAAYAAGISSSTKPDAKKKAFQRAIDDLRTQKLIQVHNDYWKPCGTRDICGTSEGRVPD